MITKNYQNSPQQTQPTNLPTNYGQDPDPATRVREGEECG